MKLARLHGIVALVLVVLVIGFFVRQSRPRALIDHTPAAKVEDAPRVGTELAKPEVDAASATRASAETQLASIAPRQDSPDDWIVLVVDGITKEPVAGAEVAWNSKRVTFRDNRQPLVTFDPESALDADARWIETDAHGLVRLAPNALPGFVCARHGNAFGTTGVNERGEAPVQVILQRALHVDIQVVDADGEPVAGVPVSLRAADSVQGAQPIWTGITAGDAGLARARHFQRGLARLKPGFDLVAGFEFPTRTASTVPVDIDHLPLEPLRLVLPSAGSVEVRVHDANGQPVSTSSVDLNITTSGEVDMFVTPNLRQFQPAIEEKGRTLYPFVETGLELSAQAVVNMAFLRASGPGPRVNGERVTFDLDAGPPKPWLVGRLVDEGGVPISDADAQCGMELEYGGTSPRTGGGFFPVKTNALGRFEITNFVPTEASTKASLSFRPFGRAAFAGGVGTVNIDAPLHDGENDLGDIVVRMPIVLVTGRVVDEQDAPLGNPLFTIETERSVQAQSTWASDPETTAKSDAGGAFKVVSTSNHAQLRIGVRKAGYVQLEPFPVTSGARDVKITLLKASEISGSVIVDPDLPPNEITVFVRVPTEREDVLKQALSGERVHVRADGTFRLVDVRPLVVDLAVRRSGMKEPLVVVPNLDLRGGGIAKDPRLVGIDLRGRMRTGHEERKVDTAPR